MTNAKGKALIDCLRGLGVEKSDIVMVHSDVSRLTKIPLDSARPLRLLLDSLLETVADGTVVVPTFSYRFCRGTTFDSARTPSEVGYFCEYVRRDPRAVRSRHPIFSVAAIGADTSFLCRNLSKSGFGQGSVFERLHVSNAKLLHFDVTLADSCTFAHFSEQKVGVPYRYSKYFRGVTIFDGETSTDEWEFYVRNTESWDFLPQPPGRLRYTDELEATGRSKTASWEGLPITVASCADVLDVIAAGIRSDPYYVLPGAPLRRRDKTAHP